MGRICRRRIRASQDIQTAINDYDDSLQSLPIILSTVGKWMSIHKHLKDKITVLLVDEASLAHAALILCLSKHNPAFILEEEEKMASASERLLGKFINMADLQRLKTLLIN